MSANRDLERRLADFYAGEGLLRAPDRALTSALATIETTPQRRAFRGGPWRIPNMSNYARLAVAAVVVIAAVAVGWALYSGRAPSVGSSPSPVPSQSSPSASPSTAPTSPAASAGPALTESFTSAFNGITVWYPAGWQLQPATEAWADGTVQQASPYADVISDGEVDASFIALASQALGLKTFDQWSADYLAQRSCDAPEPITIDGATGILAACAGGAHAFAAAEGRGFLIWLYRVDAVAWFKEIVGTVQLDPQSAVEPPPVEGTALSFRAPFAYTMPGGIGWALGPTGPNYYEFRVPDSGSGGEGSAVGIILRAIDGGRVDPCAATSAALAIADGPQAVIDYLKTIPGVAVTNETATTIDGVPAIQASITTSPTGDCLDIRPFAQQVGVEETEVISQTMPGVRVTAFDIGGEHVVMWTFLTVDDTSLYDVADELISSFDFTPTE